MRYYLTIEKNGHGEYGDNESGDGGFKFMRVGADVLAAFGDPTGTVEITAAQAWGLHTSGGTLYYDGEEAGQRDLDAAGWS